jgi:polysaccharide biosynthesis transport protein
MELRDYLQMLRRRWPAVVLITALCFGCAGLYLLVAPKRYESTTSLLVSANDLRTVGDLQSSTEFAQRAASTYAAMIDSSTVLGPVAGDLRPQRDVDDLLASVSATVPTETTLIVITAAADHADQAAGLANAVAARASRILPALAPAADGTPLIRLTSTRPATEPVSAVSPNVKRVLVLGGVVGLCLGIAAVIVAHTLDTRIRRADDLRPLTHLPVLAVLPAEKRSRRGNATGPDELAGPAGEAFRTLRTNLRFLEAAGRRSLVVTAVADHGDGAAVAVNLARSLAQAGRQVLLVDADLRESSVAAMLEMDPEAGLADVLRGHADLTWAIRRTRYQGMSVLLSGSPYAGPSDLLSAPILTGVLRRIEHDHDFVVLHAPPILGSTDAALVSGAAGGTLVTVAAGHTRAHDLQTALAALANAQVTPIGVVLSGGRPRDALRGTDGPPPAPRPPAPPPPVGPRYAGPPARSADETSPNGLPIVRPPHTNGSSVPSAISEGRG